MRILLANLKHLYQRRYLWFGYAYVGFLLFLPSSDRDSQETFALVWLGTVFSGILVGGTSREVINKPFVRCLPGHPPAVRRVVFLTGLAVSLLGGTLFMSRYRIAIWGSPAIFCAAVCLSMSIYLAGADVLLIPWTTKGPPGGILFGALFGTAMVLGTHLHTLFAPLIIRHPLWTILSGVLIGSAVWLQMGLREWSRELFSIGLRFWASNKEREKYTALERRYAKGAAASAATEAFFAGRMGRCPDYSTGRYIWGTLYTKVGNLAAWWEWLVLAFIVATVVSLYTGWGSILVFLWVSWMVVPQTWPPLHSVMLVPAGRRERFLAVVSLAAAIAGIVGLYAAVVATMSVPLSMLIPEFEIWDMSLACRLVPPATVAVPLIAVPLLATFFVLFPKRLHLVVFVAIPMVMPAAVMAASVIILWLWILHAGAGLIGGPTLWIGAGVVFAWTLFGMACFHRTRNRSLAGS
jgi:hypothetical protein